MPLASRWGVPKVAKGASFALGANYVAAVAFGLSQPATAFNRPLMVAGHTVLGCEFLRRYKQLDAESIPSVKRFYKKIWDLFYMEYVLYALI